MVKRPELLEANRARRSGYDGDSRCVRPHSGGLMRLGKNWLLSLLNAMQGRVRYTLRSRTSDVIQRVGVACVKNALTGRPGHDRIRFPQKRVPSSRETLWLRGAARF